LGTAVDDKIDVQFDNTGTYLLGGNQGNTGGVKSAKVEPFRLLSAAVMK
jgi:hypothetical protein